MATAATKALMCGMLAAALSLAVGCGEKDEDEANALNLVGTWSSDACEAKEQTNGDGSKVTIYRKTTVVFTDTTVSHSETEYSKAGCADADKDYSGKVEGTYVTGDKAAAPATAVEGATNLDITISSFTYTMHTQAEIDEFGGAKFCGVVPAKDVPIVLSKAACGADFDGPESGMVYYTIFKATETNLTWGADIENDKEAGKTVAKRAVALEATSMTKK